MAVLGVVTVVKLNMSTKLPQIMTNAVITNDKKGNLTGSNLNGPVSRSVEENIISLTY